MHPGADEFVDVGLPFGPKPRLILAYLNAEALRTGSPEIEVEDSLTAFVRRIGLTPRAATCASSKISLPGCQLRDHAWPLATATAQARRSTRTSSSGFDLWFPKDERQRVLWPSTVDLSLDYFESLQRHAVPLDERAVAALSHTAMGARHLRMAGAAPAPRRPGKPAFIPWTALKDQFGWHYGRMDKFRQVFRQTLDMVLSQYQGARLELDDRGMTLRNSPPPGEGPGGPDLQSLNPELFVGKAC